MHSKLHSCDSDGEWRLNFSSCLGMDLILASVKHQKLWIPGCASIVKGTSELSDLLGTELCYWSILSFHMKLELFLHDRTSSKGISLKIQRSWFQTPLGAIFDDFFAHPCVKICQIIWQKRLSWKTQIRIPDTLLKLRS